MLFKQKAKKNRHLRKAATTKIYLWEGGGGGGGGGGGLNFAISLHDLRA